jgi:hypothetical protein
MATPTREDADQICEHICPGEYQDCPDLATCPRRQRGAKLLADERECQQKKDAEIAREAANHIIGASEGEGGTILAQVADMIADKILSPEPPPTAPDGEGQK